MSTQDWRLLHLGDAVTFRTGKLNSNAAIKDGVFPFFTCSQETLRTNTYSFDTECVLLAGNNANGVYPLKYFSGKFDVYQRTYVIQPHNKQELSTRFLYYALRPKLDQLRIISTGAATKFLTLSILERIEINLPPYDIQQKIASILSTYDDLIENNTRRIHILEEMAQLIYREWFVHFRYPGHEAVPLVDSVLGPIPQGWEVRKLKSIADIQWGDTSVTKASYVDKGFIAFSASGPDGKLDYYDYDKPGIVLSAIGAHCGKTWYASGKWSCIKNTIRLFSLSAHASIEFIYFSTNDYQIWPKRGAAQPFISQGDAQDILVIIPTQKQMDDFTEIVKPMLQQINTMNIISINLRQQRDLLLPRLVSGELDVENICMPIKDNL